MATPSGRGKATGIPTVPVQFSEMAAGWLKRANAPNYTFTVYPEARHDSWTETYASPDVWNWLFAQRRP